MTPQSVRSAQFKSARKGLDPDEVRAFLDQVAGALEKAQNHSTAMEARARAAVHRLQEVTEAKDVAAEGASATVTTDEPSSEQADAITKTLLLAQRTADTTVAEAREEAERMLAEARDEAERAVSSSEETAAKLLEEARVEARAVGAEERQALESAVSAMMARRDFLESDVDHLEKFLDAQRERLREAAATLVEMAERVPAGLGEVHRPVLSAASAGSGDESGDDDDTGEFEPDFTSMASDDPWTDDSALEDAWSVDAAPDDAEAGTSDTSGAARPADTTPVHLPDPDPDAQGTTAEGKADDDFTLRFGDSD